MDYVEETGRTLTFGPVVSCINVSVSIINDDISEGEESFFGNLSSSAGSVTLNPDVANVIIYDDAQDRKCLHRDNNL